MGLSLMGGYSTEFVSEHILVDTLAPVCMTLPINGVKQNPK